MEQDQNSSLFSLNVDSQSKSFLTESAKWGKFLSIVGFIACTLIVIVGIYLAANYKEFENSYNRYSTQRSSVGGLGVGMAIAYIVVALLYFFPCLYLYRFSSHMKTAIASDDQANLTVAFQNLKSMFKFVGVFTLIIIALWVLGLVVQLSARA
jgi:Family of unknown function (DUF5362)